MIPFPDKRYDIIPMQTRRGKACNNGKWLASACMTNRKEIRITGLKFTFTSNFSMTAGRNDILIQIVACEEDDIAKELPILISACGYSCRDV